MRCGTAFDGEGLGGGEGSVGYLDDGVAGLLDVHDRRRTPVAVDVVALRAISALPDEWLISGLVYDVATGLVEVVVPAAPIRIAQDSLTAAVA